MDFSFYTDYSSLRQNCQVYPEQPNIRIRPIQLDNWLIAVVGKTSENYYRGKRTHIPSADSYPPNNYTSTRGQTIPVIILLYVNAPISCMICMVKIMNNPKRPMESVLKPWIMGFIGWVVQGLTSISFKLKTGQPFSVDLSIVLLLPVVNNELDRFESK